MNPKAVELRSKYPVFSFESYSYNFSGNDLNISYTFSLAKDIVFKPKLRFMGVGEKLESINKDALDNFVFSIGLAEIPSYWKTTISPKIAIKAGGLNDAQILWWRDLLIKGMHQFFYENSINFKDNNFLEIEVKSSKDTQNLPFEVGGEKILVPVGGGKDSAVTLELLGNNFKDTTAFILHPASPGAKASAELSSVKKSIEVERTLDPLLLESNAKGYLNGHTPFSSLLAFIATFAAAIFGYKYVAFSNERSSEEGNANYLGEVVNHQHSKTFEFEEKFREYNKKWLSNVDYFSFLRPLYEIQISKLFSQKTKYFPVIRSCNRGQQTNTWCGECAKCLSTFILLYPFIGRQETERMFSKNLFKNKDLFPLLESLLKENTVKPFECVGTREELKVSLFLAIKKEGQVLPLLEMAEDKLLGTEDYTKLADELLNSWSNENNVPKDFEKLLKS